MNVCKYVCMYVFAWMPDDSLREFDSLRNGGTSCANLSSRNFLLLAVAVADTEDDEDELDCEAAVDEVDDEEVVEADGLDG